MTREEHIYQLIQYLQGRLISMCPASSLYWKEHYEEIIKGLEQEPTTKNDLGVDAVSRKAVHDMLENLPVTVENKWFNWLQKACMRLAELPSVTPQEPKWIPVKFRPLTDEEKNEYPDYCYMADCPMPDDGEEILVCTTHGGVERDECVFEDGFYLDSGYDWQTDVVAWMPLPQPYKAESE